MRNKDNILLFENCYCLEKLNKCDVKKQYTKLIKLTVYDEWSKWNWKQMKKSNNALLRLILTIDSGFSSHSQTSDFCLD